LFSKMVVIVVVVVVVAILLTYVQDCTPRATYC